MVEVVKSYEMVLTFNNFKASFSYVCGEKIGSIADIGRKIFNMLILVLKIFLTILVRKIFLTSHLPPPVNNISGNNFYDLVKILGKVGQNMTNPPPPQR